MDVDLAERRQAFGRFIGAATIAWTIFVVTDFLAVHVYGADLKYLLTLRLVGTVLGSLLYWLSRRESLGETSVALMENVPTSLCGLIVSLAALPCGGPDSPLAIGVAMVTMTRGVLPAPWQRALPSALGSSLAFPAVMLVMVQVTTKQAWNLAATSLFLTLGAFVAAGASHLLYSAKEQIHHARRLGSYRLVARIGTGGMGEVWMARQMPLNRRVALKILKEATLKDPAALRRFKREAEAASSLEHPHTIRVFDFGASDDGVFFIAMELLDGMDLEVLVDRLGPLPPARVVYLAQQICDALSEAHARGIIHCDLKPANLFITKLGGAYDFAKVLDFGLARLTIEAGHTTVESLRGTPAFMPPEIVKGESPSPETDVYAVGAVLYWMVTGSPPFRGSNFHESVIAHVEREPEPPSTRLGHPIPDDLEAIILKCLAKAREDRFTSARALGNALGACKSAGEWSSDQARASWQELRPSLSRLEATDAR